MNKRLNIIGLTSYSIFIVIALIFPAMVLAATGDYQSQWGMNGSTSGKFDQPMGVAVDDKGNVYVVDTGNNRVQKFNSSGAFEREWGGFGTGNGQFNQPTDIALVGWVVFVADTGNNRIQRFDRNGNFNRQWGSAGNGEGEFNEPTGVAVDKCGRVYVADTGNHRIQIFNFSGNFNKEFGSAGSGDGQFSRPMGVTVYGCDNLYVADTDNHRVQKFYFGWDGTFSLKWGTAGSANGQFNRPRGMATDRYGNVYVTDANNNRVQEFDSSGSFIRTWGSYGTGNGQFDNPGYLALNNDKEIYVVDSDNHRVQKFDGEPDRPDLEAVKLDTVGSQTTSGTPFNWEIEIKNTETADATFTNGQIILKDDLPSGATYAAPVVGSATNITNQGNINCDIAANTLTCKAEDVGVTIGASTGKFKVTFQVTPGVDGTLVNPANDGVCQVDPEGVLPEEIEDNNDCQDAVSVDSLPNLEIAKSTDPDGVAFKDEYFIWKVTITNTGDGAAIFETGEIIFRDILPPGRDGIPSIFAEIKSADSLGQINCMASGLTGEIVTCETGPSDLVLVPKTGQVEVSIYLKFSSVGTYNNPDPANAICRADPDGHVTESDETDNDCADTVSVIVGSDLEVEKQNGLGGASATLGVPFDWDISIKNTGPGDAVFTSGQIIFKDDLPVGATYGAVTVSNDTGINDINDVDCKIDGTTLTCTATGVGVTIGNTNGEFKISFEATPVGGGNLVNPVSGGVCKVDPDDNMPEEDENNNECSDSVTVPASDLEAKKQNDIREFGIAPVIEPFDWEITLKNTGPVDAIFTDGQTIFRDELPNGTTTYGAVNLGGDKDITNFEKVACNIVGTTLSCRANGGAVTIGANTGQFRIDFEVKPGAEGYLVNPKKGGACKVDPDGSVAENDETNNKCHDIVTLGEIGVNNGQLDPTFDEDGKVITIFGSEGSTSSAIAIQSDGKIVMVGNTRCSGCQSDFVMARYNVDGSLDNTFGSSGKVTTDFGPARHLEHGFSVAIQSDDKIVVAGVALSGYSGPELVLARYNSDGSLDDSFGTDGRAPYNFANGVSGYDLAIQSDGKIIIAGGSYGDFALVRYQADGSLDNTFGAGGLVTTDFSGGSESGNSLAIQSDGKIVVAGRIIRGRTGNFALARYHSDGSLDNTFGAGGLVTTDLGGQFADVFYFDSISDIVIQPDGKIVATGSISINAEFELIFALARYHPNGVLDNSFGTSGVVITQFGWNHAMGSAVVMRPGGKIMAAGSVRIDPLVDSDFALARFNPDGLLDSTFGSGGLVTIDFGGSDYASDLTLHYDGKIVIGGTTRDSTGVNNFALARYMPPLLDEPEGGAGMRSFDVGASGGTFTFGPVKIVIPAGLLNDGSRLVVEELDPSDEGNFQLGNRIFDITIYGPDGILITSFNPPLKICIKPTNAELQRTDWNIANLQMFHRHDGGSWTILVYTYAENGSICAAISELSYFAIGIAPLPNTGFAPNLEFDLPEKPAGQAYSSMDSYQLIIPALEVELPIVGVPLTAQGWDVSWLGETSGLPGRHCLPHLGRQYGHHRSRLGCK